MYRKTTVHTLALQRGRLSAIPCSTLPASLLHSASPPAPLRQPPLLQAGSTEQRQQCRKVAQRSDRSKRLAFNVPSLRSQQWTMHSLTDSLTRQESGAMLCAYMQAVKEQPSEYALKLKPSLVQCSLYLSISISVSHFLSLFLPMHRHSPVCLSWLYEAGWLSEPPAVGH